MHQWLSRLTEKKTNFKEDQFSNWTPTRINILKRVNNEISQAADFWTTRTLEAFVTEFAIATSTSFSKAEWEFFKGPRGKYLNLFNLKIKMLLAEKGILLIESN